MPFGHVLCIGMAPHLLEHHCSIFLQGALLPLPCFPLHMAALAPAVFFLPTTMPCALPTPALWFGFALGQVEMLRRRAACAMCNHGNEMKASRGKDSMTDVDLTCHETCVYVAKTNLLLHTTYIPYVTLFLRVCRSHLGLFAISVRFALHCLPSLFMMKKKRHALGCDVKSFPYPVVYTST